MSKYKSVKIIPHESYFGSGLVKWIPNEGRAYVISINSILPERARNRIKDAFVEKGFNNKMVTFGYFNYDRSNKILFLEDDERGWKPI